MMADEDHDVPTPLSLQVALWCAAALLRVLVGYQPHSGQDNYHGAHGVYGGDFEAQRHWMEVTYHLPVGQWYWFDLQYWGLDYPPLSAYQSWFCGWLSHHLVGPESVALYTSRGYEDATHKAFMRATVIALDLTIFGNAVYVLTKSEEYNRTRRLECMAVRFFVMIQPSVLLIDHGHFQYNTTAIGLALWTVAFCRRSPMKHCIYGSIMFCLALTFKQMTLYYAPAIFAYLLGRCWASDNIRIHWILAFRRIALLGLTVIATFTLFWWPFIAYGPSDTTSWERLVHVVRRVIPLQRGLFESKVANLWCVLSLKPVRIRHRIPASMQLLASLTVTVLLIMPACVQLFRAGRSRHQSVAQSQQTLLLGLTSTALGFFLGSFQVHEKSILLAVAPLSLLVTVDFTLVLWFSVLATWSLWPLLTLDRLQLAYACTLLIYLSLIEIYREVDRDQSLRRSRRSFFASHAMWKVALPLSLVAMITLHVAELVYTPPIRMPDLFAVLWAIVGCAGCCVAWCATVWHLYHADEKAKRA